MSDREEPTTEGRHKEPRREDELRREEERRREDERRAREATALERTFEVIAASTLRIGLIFLGIVIVLFAIGQLVGVDIVSVLSEVFGTRAARWLAVAFFGLVLIVVAMTGFRRRTRV